MLNVFFFAQSSVFTTSVPLSAHSVITFLSLSCHYHHYHCYCCHHRPLVGDIRGVSATQSPSPLPRRIDHPFGEVWGCFCLKSSMVMTKVVTVHSAGSSASNDSAGRTAGQSSHTASDDSDDRWSSRWQCDNRDKNVTLILLKHVFTGRVWFWHFSEYLQRQITIARFKQLLLFHLFNSHLRSRAHHPNCQHLKILTIVRDQRKKTDFLLMRKWNSN